MNDECLICGAPLIYTEQAQEHTCALCGKKAHSKTVCEKGHYVCDHCHMNGVDTLVGFCLSSQTTDPISVLRGMMQMPFCHMHGPEHHIMVGAALLTAYKNAGGEIHLAESLIEMLKRGKQVPGGACGFWGACGAGVSTGMFVSIITGATPLKNKEWAWSNEMTARSLQAIAACGGPRCCKRNSYIAVLQAVSFVQERLGIAMTPGNVVCQHAHLNNRCIGNRCPFSCQ